MKILTKRIFLAMLTLCMVLCGALFTMSLTVFADESANSVTFETANFVMKEGASVRIGSNEAGTEFDYSKNGIRFMAKMSISEYEAIKDDATITYGILIAPKDYHDANPLNEENVFGENSVYSFDDSKIKIANITTAALAPIDEDNDGNTDYYGYNASMVNVNTDNVTRQFVAVSYMMQSTEIWVEGEFTGAMTNVYRFCDDNMASRSMSYVAQKAVEKAEDDTSTPDWLVPALKESYITGRTTTVSLAWEKYYGEDVAAASNTSIALELDTEVSSEEITQILVDKGIVDESFVLSNETSIDGKKVYADGATGTLTLKYTAAESDVTDYNKIKGYYQTEDGTKLVLKADKTVEINGAAAVAYTLYKDGTVKTTVNEQTTFGSYDLDEGTFSLTVDSSVLDYAEVLELGNSVYGAVAKLYDYNGTLINLNKNGTLVYDYAGANQQSGVYVLCYDESTEKYYIVIYADTVITKEISETDGAYSISDFTTVELASEADYTAIAEYYTESTSNVIYKFNTDGTIVSNGTNVGSFSYLSNGSIYATINNVVLFGTFEEKSNAVYTKNVIELNDKEQTVSYVLSHTEAVNYNVYDVFADEDGVIYYGDVKGAGGYGRLYLYNIKTDMEALTSDVGLDGETKWYQCKYYLTSWGFAGYNTNPYAYRLEPTTYKDGVCVGGKIYFYFAADHGTKSSTFGIDDDGKLWVNVNYTPNGDSDTYCVQYAKEEELSISSSESESIYDIFATTEGVKYGVGSRYVALFSTKTSMTVPDSPYDWYTAEWSEGGVTHSTSKICYRLEPITDDGLFGRIYFYNGYHSSGTMYYGIVNGVRYVDARTWDPNASTYSMVRVAYADNYINVTNTVDAHIADMKGKVYENAGAGAESVTFDVYADIAGKYNSKTHYGSTAQTFYGIGFTLNADRTTSITVDKTYTGTYELIPYTDTFGKLNFTPGYNPGGNYDGTSTFWGYYSKINGEYVIRMMWSSSGVRYWHFIDFSKSGSTFSSWDIFDAVVGTEANAVYTDGNATLELALIADNYNAANPAGSKFVFTSGGTVVNGTYDFVATSTTAGKIFMDFNSNASYYNPSDVDRYVIGEYALIDGQYVISFNYNGTDYAMNVSGNTDVDDVVRNAISGTYAGANTTLTIDGNSTVNATSLYTGTVNIGDVTAEFVIEDNRIIITYKDASYNDVIAIKAR